MPPQVRHSGGRSAGIASQQLAHTGPSSGCSRTALHAAQRGATATAMSASPTDRRRSVAVMARAAPGLHAFDSGIRELVTLRRAPQPLEGVERAALAAE